MKGKAAEKTFSVCPVCLKRIPAERLYSGGKAWLRKKCAAHGIFKTIIWHGNQSSTDWTKSKGSVPAGNPDCPNVCGLCAGHMQGTCCTLLEVTGRCNLNCTFCLAGGGGKSEPTFAKLKSDLARLTVPGETLLQLSGGEPTMRDDLPEVIAAAKQAGCKYVQLNSNGLRLAEDRKYLRKLAEAGLSFVFMQFDGTEDAIYQKLRGRALFKIKQQAIENCSALNIGVTLVPTLVPGVNIQKIGETIHFAVSQSPAVRGVHFQPVSFFGRIPAPPSDDMRFTLDQLIFEIERQTDGVVKAKNLLPSCCDHPACGFHGDFVIGSGREIFPLSARTEATAACCCGPATAEQNREYVARRWQRPAGDSANTGPGNLRDMEYFARRAKSHGFTITGMAFQDAGNLDLERLRRCSLHVYDAGKFVPLCVHYLTAWQAS